LKGMCVECEDQPACLTCNECQEDFCEVCFNAQHRKGKRKLHSFVAIPGATLSLTAPKPAQNGSAPRKTPVAEDDDENEELPDAVPVPLQSATGDYFLERSRYIPVRLALEERKYLRLLEAALNVSEYTDKVDILAYTGKAKRMFAQIKDICAILSGLLVASDYPAGQNLVRDKNFDENALFFQRIFEIGRRHKIMNPEKMRASYGKLVYLLQDSMIPDVHDMLQFDCVDPIHTVYRALDEGCALAVLKDEAIHVATREIIPESKSRREINAEIKQKERAIEYIANRYRNGTMGPDDIKQCLYSIGDNHAFLRQSRDACDKMILYLTNFFSPDRVEKGYDLTIVGGRGGARLTHDHAHQYHYVLQSLTLWREILHDMFKIWYLAETDLLESSNPYRLRDTGQGLNRIQSAPRVGSVMRQILVQTQQKLGNWVGSSVIHLGDHNVPNALMFIDKYTQVPRILNPIVLCLEKIGDIIKNPDLKKYIDSTFGGESRLRKIILTDFFRHAFDGSGADNFFDAGSCIDGRLTSAWNWCQ